MQTDVNCYFMTKTLLLIFTLLTGCKVGSLPEKDLSISNISHVELSFPNNRNQAPTIKLDSIQIKIFAKILNERKQAFAEPKSCYNIFIKLKDGGGVQYRTDGVSFEGYDDSSDLPFSFSTTQNIITEVFKLKVLNNCK